MVINYKCVYSGNLIDSGRKVIFCVVGEVCLNSKNRRKIKVVKISNRQTKTDNIPSMWLKIIQTWIKAYQKSLKTDK